MIRIVIAEDQQMLLGTLGSLLNLEDGMEVVGQASNGKEAVALVKQLQPDICIMDINMPEKNGLQAAEELKDIGCNVVMITTFARKGYFQQALQAGVKGFLLKDSPSELLASSIRDVMAGKLVYAPELMEEVNEEDAFLFERELLLDKNHQKQNNTVQTVKGYLSFILDKMKLPTG